MRETHSVAHVVIIVSEPVTYSLFIRKPNFASEQHELTKGEAYELAMKALYDDNAYLISGANVQIRTSNHSIEYTATNPK
jgi:hypothetical protein